MNKIDFQIEDPFKKKEEVPAPKSKKLIGKNQTQKINEEAKKEVKKPK